MDSVTLLSVGLDYHPGSVQVCVLDAADGRVLVNQACADDWRRIAGLAARHGVVRGAAVEACCGSADLAEQLIRHAGWPTALAHPGLVRRMKNGPDKHDKGDAHVLADLRRVGYLPAVWLAPAPVRELRRLVRFRQQLADRRRDVKLRVGATLRDLRLVPPAGAAGSRWTKRWLAWVAAVEVDASTRWVLDEHLLELRQLGERITLAEERLARVTADDPVVRRLLRQPGVGPVTAWVIRAEVGRFDRFRRAKQLCRFCGLTPCNASSNERQADRGLVHAGNPALKSVLVEAAHRLARHDPRWRALYARLRAAGKPACVALAAVANRWVRTLFHQMTAIDTTDPAAAAAAAAAAAD